MSLYDADVFLQFRVFSRLLVPISVPNHSRDSFISLKLNTLYSCKECIIANWSKWYISLNQMYLYDADVFLQFRVLIRLLVPISVPNHSRDSFISFKLNTLYSSKECIRANWSKWYISLNQTYLYVVDVFLQFLVFIRLLVPISFPNHSRDSLIQFKLNTLYSSKEWIRANWSKWYISLKQIYLYDVDVFLQFRVLIRLLVPISVPNHSRDSFISFKLNTLYSSKECIIANWSKWYISLNQTYLYDADVFLQFRVLIRLLVPISVPNHSRDSLIQFKLNTLYTCKECIRANWSKWYNSLNWTYLYDADVFHQFRVLFRLLEPISVPNHSRDSLTLFKLNTLYSSKEWIRANWSKWYISLNQIYLYDVDVFLQFRVLIRLLVPISVPNHSRDSFISFKLNTLYSSKECIRANWSKWYISLNQTYLYVADIFLQFRVFIRLLVPISFPNHSRDSLIQFKLNTLYSSKECIRANWSKWYISLNQIYLYDVDVFLQFRVLIRLLVPISVPNHSRDSFISFKLNTLYSSKECIIANWSKWYISLNQTYLYDADVFLQFRVLIRLLVPISVPNHSRDSLIQFKLNTLYTCKECIMPIGVSGIFHLIRHIFMMQMFSINFGFCFGFQSPFPSRITPEIH